MQTDIRPLNMMFRSPRDLHPKSLNQRLDPEDVDIPREKRRVDGEETLVSFLCWQTPRPVPGLLARPVLGVLSIREEGDEGGGAR